MEILRSSLVLRLCYSKQQRVYSQSVKPFESIPGPKSFPIIGTLYNYLPFFGKYKFDRQHHNAFLRLKEYGPLVREDIVPGVPIVWVYMPDDIETMYRCEGRYPERRSHLALQKYRCDNSNIYNSGGLLPTNGDEWWRLRKIFQKDLNRIQNVRLYLPKSDEAINTFLNSRIPACNGDLLPELSRLFLELTGLVAFDESLKSFEDAEIMTDSMTSKLISSTATINNCVLKTDNGPQLWRKFNTPLYKKFCEAHGYLDSVAIEFVGKKKSLLKSKTDCNYSLLEHYLLNEELDIKDVTGMVADMLLAGIDTMAYTASFGLYHISKNLRVQNTMFEELQQILSAADEPVNEEKLNASVFTKAVLKELFRMNPISVGVGRILAKDAILCGYHVPAGKVIVTQNQITSRLPSFFKNPDIFLPERWIKGSCHYTPVHPYLVLPFGHGPRTCIARRLAEQNLQLFLMKAVRKYKMVWKGVDYLDSRSIQINKPEHPIIIDFEGRQ